MSPRQSNRRTLPDDMTILRRIRTITRELALVFLAVVIIALANSPGVYSVLDIATSPYKFRLVQWELDNLPDKWWDLLAGALPWASRDDANPNQLLVEFTALAQELRHAEFELERLAARVATDPSLGRDDAQRRVATLQRELDALSPRAQTALEAEINIALEQQDLASRWGTVFPPVDLVFTGAPLVLVVSPRDRIERQDSMLLDTRIKVSEMERLEDELLRKQDSAALVLRAGGVASYPSMVNASGGLYNVVVTAVHEWLHHYWFFRPLGWNYFSNDTMTTLNETAADLAGKELGAMVYQNITGQPPPQALHPEHDGTHDHPGAFNFFDEMRETRLEVDRLLEQKRIPEAEAYMEERRQVFVENGYTLRKLNQAYFAFHGAYGTSPSSISPIQGQVELVRAHTTSVGEFVHVMSQFGDYAKFEEYVVQLPPVHVAPTSEVPSTGTSGTDGLPSSGTTLP